MVWYMYAYLRKLNKPYSVTVAVHVDRMEILVKYTNKFPGMEEEMNDDQKKRLIFESFLIK